MQIAGLLGISMARHASAMRAGFDYPTLLFIPASLLGTAFGLKLFSRMTDRQFGQAVNLLLIASGLSYVI